MAITDSHRMMRSLILLAGVYAQQGDMPALGQLMRRKPIVILAIAAGLSIVALGGAILVAGPLMIVQLASRHPRPHALLFSHVRWGMRDIFSVCLALLFIPPLFGMAAGRLSQGNWFAVLFARETLASAGAQSALAGQYAAMIFISALILWRIRRHYGQQWQDIGLRPVALRLAMSQTLRAVLLLMVFSAAYHLLFVLITGHGPQAQTISKVLDSSPGHPGLALLVGHVVLFGPLTEELIFRGFVFSGLRRRADFPLAAGMSAVLFAAFHFNVGLFLPIAVMGMVFAWLFERTRSMWPGFAVHVIWNLLGVGVALGMAA